VQVLRKLLRALAMIVCGGIGVGLLVDAGLYGPADYQLIVAAGVLLFASGLTLTWFWSPLG
jgi:hypothetical protein